MEQQSDRFVKQQKLMVLMAVVCFVMMIVVVVFGWYVFRYSSTKIQKNSETMAQLLKNANLQNSGETLNAGQIEVDNVKAGDFANKENQDSTNLTAQEIIKMVSKHMLLANGDVVVATITNIEGLRLDFPELFTYAKDGDRLIFYSLGIIVYDPVLDKVVDVLRRLPADVVVPKSVTEEK